MTWDVAWSRGTGTSELQPAVLAGWPGAGLRDGSPHVFIQMCSPGAPLGAQHAGSLEDPTRYGADVLFQVQGVQQQSQIREERDYFEDHGMPCEGRRLGGGRTRGVRGLFVRVEPMLQLRARWGEKTSVQRVRRRGAERGMAQWNGGVGVWCESFCSSTCHWGEPLPGLPHTGRHHGLSCLCSGHDISYLGERYSPGQGRFEQTTPTSKQAEPPLICGSEGKLTCHQDSYQ